MYFESAKNKQTTQQQQKQFKYLFQKAHLLADNFLVS